MLSSLMSIWSSGEFSMWHIVFLLLTYAVLIFVSLPVHEFAHAFAANRLGDSTARWHGRLTLNPLKHLDTFGTLMLVLCGFGYARPVPVNPYNFRNPKRGMALTAFAGPLSNLIMAIAAVGIYRIILLIAELQGPLDMESYMMWMDILTYSQFILIHIFASINLGLAVFNLLPIPPLDGSRIFSAILPDRWVYTMERYEHYISAALMIMLLVGVFDVPLSLLRQGFGFVICSLFGMPNVFS